MHMVAAQAGVSIATVSRVISGSPRVLPETAVAVQRVIDELSFVPDATAVTLKQGHSDSYGIIVPDATNPFFLEFIRDFEGLLVQRQNGILLANTDLRQDRIEDSIHRMIRNRVRGIVVMLAEEKIGLSNRFALRHVPIVTIDRLSIQPLVSDVSYRFDLGMLQAIDHLHSLGHRRIGLIGGTREFPTSKHRVSAFVAAMRHFKIPVQPWWIAYGDYRVDGGDQMMRELMKLDFRPTAVIAVSDLMALGALRATHALEMSVPRDVSIVGFDDIFLSEIVSPSLTTVRLPRKAMAEACIRAFTHMAENPKHDGLQISIETTLVVRRSTAVPL